MARGPGEFPWDEFGNCPSHGGKWTKEGGRRLAGKFGHKWGVRIFTGSEGLSEVGEMRYGAKGGDSLNGSGSTEWKVKGETGAKDRTEVGRTHRQTGV